MNRSIASLAAALAVAAVSSAFAQEQGQVGDPGSDPGLAAFSAMTCADFVKASGRDRASAVAALTAEARRMRQPGRQQASPLPGQRFAPVPTGSVVGACTAHPELKVVEVVDSEVSTSR